MFVTDKQLITIIKTPQQLVLNLCMSSKFARTDSETLGERGHNAEKGSKRAQRHAELAAPTADRAADSASLRSPLTRDSQKARKPRARGMRAGEEQP